MELNEKLNPREEKIRLILCFDNFFSKYHKKDDNSPNFPFAVINKTWEEIDDFDDLYQTLKQDIECYCSNDDIDLFYSSYENSYLEEILKEMKVYDRKICLSEISDSDWEFLFYLKKKFVKHLDDLLNKILKLPE